VGAARDRPPLRFYIIGPRSTIPAKYKILMTMIVDALLSHPDGVANIANRARGAGASEAEIQGAVEVAYLFGGTPALVTAVNAFRAP